MTELLAGVLESLPGRASLNMLCLHWRMQQVPIQAILVLVSTEKVPVHSVKFEGSPPPLLVLSVPAMHGRVTKWEWKRVYTKELEGLSVRTCMPQFRMNPSLNRLGEPSRVDVHTKTSCSVGEYCPVGVII